MNVRVKLRSILTAILALSLITSFYIPSVALADTGAGTITGNLTLVATYECISVYASFSSDNNSNDSALLEYKLHSGSTWIRGMDMTVDRRATILSDGSSVTNPYCNQWRASILGLNANTSYDIRVTFSDADGVTGTNPVTGTITTRNDNFDSLSYSGNSYYVSVSGNDTSGNGTLANPWKTIQKGVDSGIHPGDTIYVRGGTYNLTHEVVMSTNGTSSAYITLRNYQSEAVTINATGVTDNFTSPYSCGIHAYANYLRIKGITVIGGGQGIPFGIYAGPSTRPIYNPSEPLPHDVVVEDCTLRDAKTLASTPAPYLPIVVGYMSQEEKTDIPCNNFTIQNNTIYVVEPGATVLGTQSGPGISMFNANGGNVIRNNSICFTGKTTIHGMDGINSSPNFSFKSTIRDTDIYSNYIEGATDDAISLDGNGCNVRVWNNIITRANQGISVCPILIGPAYVYRNIFYKPQNSWIGNNGWTKGGESGTGNVYLYHNTVVYDALNVGSGSPSNLGFVQWGNGANSTNVYLRNNIIETNGQVTASGCQWPNMDYDLIYNHSDLTTYWTKWNDAQIGAQSKTNAQNFAAFQTYTSGLGNPQEVHGIAGQATFVNKASNDYHLASGSPGINAGVLIYGFNDANSPWPFKGSAPDVGAYEREPGVPAPPVLAEIGNKTTHPGFSLQFTISATDPNDDSLTYSASNLPLWATFTPATRTFSGTANQTGIYPNVIFQVSDGTFSDSENITISVTENQAPVLTNPGDKTVNEGALLTFTLCASDPDGDPLTYSANNTPSGATLNTTNGTFSWTPSYTQAGTYRNIRFNVTDSALSDSENITITVNNVNRPPVLSSIGNKSVTAGQTLSFTISGSDPDGDGVTYSANNIPSGASFNGTTRVFSWTPGITGSFPNIQFRVSDGSLTASENITITVIEPVFVPSGGGGGGGDSGGGGSVGETRITSLSGSMRPDGFIIDEVSAVDIDLKVELRIPKGTIVKNKVGEMVPSLRVITQAESTAANSGSEIIGQSFDIEQSGTTFNPSANLIFNYSRVDIPANISVNNLFIALWNPAAMTWIDLGGTINTATHTITVPIQHLSTYALMAHNRPADFKTSKFTLTSTEIDPGQALTASIEVKNQGDLPGTYKVSLNLDNTTAQTKEVTVDGNGSVIVSFTVTPDAVGEHRASIGDMQAAYVVKKPPSPAVFTVNELNVNPLLPDSGENVDVSVLVKNTGDLSGTYQAIVTVDDIAIQTKEVTLDGTSSQTLSFSFASDTVGQHKVSIGGLVAPFEVKQPAPLLPPPASDTKVSTLGISSFRTAPSYDDATNRLVSARIVYQMNETWASSTDTKLMLTVFRDGQFLEQIPLLNLNQMLADGKTGELNYVPPSKWATGDFTFRAELYQGESLIQDISSQESNAMPVTTASIVSWKILGIIIGVVLAVGSIILILVLYFRRDMLRDYWK